MKVLSHLSQLLLVFVFLTAGVFAQIEVPEPCSLTDMPIAGKQTSDGIYNETFGETRGNTFVLDGDLSGENRCFSSTLLTVSLEYAGAAGSESGNEISGGTWNLAVYRNGAYAGSIFGKIAKGNIEWYVAEDYCQTTARLVVLGGTDSFENTSMSEASISTQTMLSSDQTVGGLTWLGSSSLSDAKSASGKSPNR